MRAEELFKAFADESRVKIVLSLSSGPKFVEQLSEELNIGVSTVSFHLKKLLSAGVVTTKKEQYYQVYSLNGDLMRRTFFDVLSCENTPAVPAENDAFARKVVEECFVDGRVEKLPVQIKKRMIIYRETLKNFKDGEWYSQGEASVIIADTIDDFITAKREMVELKLIEEADGRIRKVSFLT